MLGMKNYTLTICEKPSTARKIAKAIAEDDFREVWIEGIRVYIAKKKGKTFLICYSFGHLFKLNDPTRNRHVYPIFEVEWVPLEKIKIKKIITVIRKLANYASEFVNACDFDQEGEVIGYNILKNVCGNKHEKAYRAKFATLTEEDIKNAFKRMRVVNSVGLANAGRTRHVLDYIYGINLSRALSESIYSTKKQFRNLSIGRVQGPTLSFVFEKEMKIRTYVPIPYWQVKSKFKEEGKEFDIHYKKEKIMKIEEARKIVSECKGQNGKVTEIRHKKTEQQSPVPFNLGDLQKEAYRLFGFSPSLTSSISERLYLDALISYPRTSSQKLPRSVNCKTIIEKLRRIDLYTELSTRILKGKLIPHEGAKDDSAHPAIYPTGEGDIRKLESEEWKIYDLIVKRFFATFGSPALRENTRIVINVDGYKFIAKGRTTTHLGWTSYYKPYFNLVDIELPRMNINDIVRMLGIKNVEKHIPPPIRFNQASLVEKMEEEGIGTKGTRAQIVSTLIERGYVKGKNIEITDLGFVVIEVMQIYMPYIIGTELTRTIERQLENISQDKIDEKKVIQDTIRLLTNSLDVFRSNERKIGKEISDVIANTSYAQKQLDSCPLCTDGVLHIIRSRQTGKRFIGCSNYEKGCRASMPLPQSGIIGFTMNKCYLCKWPVLLVKIKNSYVWKMCVNIHCHTKKIG